MLASIHLVSTNENAELEHWEVESSLEGTVVDEHIVDGRLAIQLNSVNLRE